MVKEITGFLKFTKEDLTQSGSKKLFLKEDYYTTLINTGLKFVLFWYGNSSSFLKAQRKCNILFRYKYHYWLGLRTLTVIRDIM